jgi:hypothetical protein
MRPFRSAVCGFSLETNRSAFESRRWRSGAAWSSDKEALRAAVGAPPLIEATVGLVDPTLAVPTEPG